MRNKGFSLVAALVGMLILGILTWILNDQILGFHVQESKDMRKMGAYSALAIASNLILDGPSFFKIRQMCENAAAPGVWIPELYPPVPFTGANPCELTGNPKKLTTNQAINSSDFLNVLVDENATASSSGKYCLRISRCFMRAQGRLIEMVLSIYWEDAVGLGNLQTAAGLARKTKW